MRKIRAFINYETTDRPWGGSNSFLSALKWYMNQIEDIDVIEDFSDRFELMLLNTAYTAPGRYISLSHVRHYRSTGYKGLHQMLLHGFKRRRFRIALRLDGLRRNYSDAGNTRGDDIQIELTGLSDGIIFQSMDSRRQFETITGELPIPYRIIRNGVNQNLFNMKKKQFWNGNSTLRIFATSWSPNPGKGFSEIAKLSRIDGVTVNFVGNWPDGLDPGNVNIAKPLSQDLLAEEYKKNHIFQ